MYQNRMLPTDRSVFLFLMFAFGATLLSLAQTPEPFEVRRPEAVFEELPVLNATEILRPEFLTGPHYPKVQGACSHLLRCKSFTIDSDFGGFEANGNDMLVTRIKEINAIARLQEVSRTDEFKNALTNAAKSPIASAKNIVTDPVNTISNAPKGLMKFMRRAGEGIKDIGNKKSVRRTWLKAAGCSS